MKKVDKSVKVRRYCGISYLTVDLFMNVLSSHSSHLRNFAFIEHNKDYFTEGDKNGEPKERHIHFVLLLKYSYLLSYVNSWFVHTDNEGKIINTFVEPCTDPVSYVRYFTHKDHPDKAQYSQSDIFYGDPLGFLKNDDSETSEDSAFIALQLMLEGESRYDIARKLGRDYIYHYHHIKALYNDIMAENQYIEREE